MKTTLNWTQKAENTLTGTKHRLTDLSITVRTDQFNLLRNLIEFTPKIKVLDVGTSSEEALKDSNLFLRQYPYPQALTTATIEDDKRLQKLYPNINVIKIKPFEKLPFKDQNFDLVTSWAVLEHVGDLQKQADFINELLRVGKNVFITTPYRGCIYEPHSGLFFVHWLPLGLFRKFCQAIGKTFWADESNLNPLYKTNLEKMALKKPIKIQIYKTLGFLPSHLIITSSNLQ